MHQNACPHLRQKNCRIHTKKALPPAHETHSETHFGACICTHSECIAVLILNGRQVASSGSLLHQDQDPCTVPWADCSTQVWNTTSDSITPGNPANNNKEARFFGNCYKTSRSDALGDLYTQTRTCPVTVVVRPLAVPGEFFFGNKDFCCPILRA